MDILYISALCSKAKIERIHELTGRNPGYAMQKFNRLMAEGLAAGGHHVSTLSALPVLRGETSLLCSPKSDSDNGVEYRYIPFVNLPVVRHAGLFLYSFFYTLFRGIGRRRKRRMVFDALNISVCLGGLLASKINRVPTCGILTDLPGQIVGRQSSIKGRFVSAINNRYLGSFDSYVFLTEAMDSAVNKRHRPYIVMEGLVESDREEAADAKRTDKKNAETMSPTSIIYAGGLYAKYGVRMLIEAFMGLERPDLTLDLYGSGDMEKEIRDYSCRDPRIRFHGIVSNDEIVKLEKQALLLVNPRPTHEDFTRYSFPSKNMEYMLSGTPVLTTRLPGMPADYHPYVYLFDEETTAGYRRTLEQVTSLPLDELRARGEAGRRFVLTRKNNHVQGRRIIALLASLIPAE